MRVGAAFKETEAIADQESKSIETQRVMVAESSAKRERAGERMVPSQ